MLTTPTSLAFSSMQMIHITSYIIHVYKTGALPKINELFLNNMAQASGSLCVQYSVFVTNKSRKIVFTHFKKCPHEGSNYGPSVYKTDALPLSCTGHLITLLVTNIYTNLFIKSVGLYEYLSSRIINKLI